MNPIERGTAEYMDYKRVEDLQPGDMVDLEGDAYADPEGEEPDCEACASRRDFYKYEFEEVHGVEQETPDCVVVSFGMDAIGFPTGHRVFVVQEAEELV